MKKMMLNHLKINDLECPSISSIFQYQEPKISPRHVKCTNKILHIEKEKININKVYEAAMLKHLNMKYTSIQQP